MYLACCNQQKYSSTNRIFTIDIFDSADQLLQFSFFKTLVGLLKA